MFHAVMTNGSYLLMAYPLREPAALVARDDAGLLREALTAAFQSPEDEDSGATGRKWEWYAHQHRDSA